MGISFRQLRCGRRGLAALLVLGGCTLPSIHRESGRDAGAVKVESDAAAADGSDAGPGYDPEKDPRNRNESLDEFLALVPKAHLFAEWPMPDSAPESKHKPSYTVSAEVVTDNVTKLRWQRDLPDIYPGCTGNYVFVGRPRGEGSGCTWEEAQAYCKRPELAKQLGGGSWRLPTKIELESLIDQSRINTIDPSLDDFPVERLWSANPVLNPEGLKLAWALDYMEGTSFDTARYKGGRVRCVSSDSESGGAEPGFELDGTLEVVYDRTSQLSWQRAPDSAARSWQDGFSYCAKLPLAGGGWRVPSLKELLTIVDSSRRWPAIQLKTFPGAQNDIYWSASEYLNGKGSAYKVDFKMGGANIVGAVTDLHYVRCVRFTR